VSVTSPPVTPVKKVYAWLSDEERFALEQYCKTEGKSMYSVLKEAVGRTIQGKSPSPSSVTPKQDTQTSAPPPTVQVLDPKLRETVNRLATQVDKIESKDLLWNEVGDIKQRLARLETMMELDVKIAQKVEEVVEKVFVGLKRSV